MPAQVLVQNLSNVPTTFQVTWLSQEDAVVFEPKEPQRVNLAIDEVTRLPYTARPSRRPLVGGEQHLPYKVTVNNVATQEADQQTQVLESNVATKGRLPVWAAVVVILLLCLCAFAGVMRFLPGFFVSPGSATPTPAYTVTLAPTATQSNVDQAPLLKEVKLVPGCV